jgi:hypothetical protein
MEHIGYIKAPIEENDLAQTRKTMQAHGAEFHKASYRDPTDKWWLIIFPQGTLREKSGPQTQVPRYKIVLPDGYIFHFEAGKLSHEGLFTQDPVLFLDQAEEVEKAASGPNQ